MFEKINPKDFKKIGFVASGGAAKALFYHIGVTFALKERGIEFPISAFRAARKSYIELVVGSSGGSIFAAFIANGFDEVTIQQKLEEKELLSYIISFQKRQKGDLTGFSYADIFLPNVPLNMRDVRETAGRVGA
ncbi:MAG: patatin-like phospholipase family protein, partial [bacterium]